MDLGLDRARQDGRQHARAASARAGTPSSATTATPTSATSTASRSWSRSCPRPKVVWVMVPGRRPDPRDRQGARRAARRGRPRRRRRQLALDRRPGATPRCSADKGIGFVDCGVSGGVWGLENGYALMSGGDEDDVAKVQPVFDALKPEGEFGWVHAGKVGRRALLQDGPQRHRVRHDAGLRRGLGAAREGRRGRQRHRGLPLLARGHRDPVLAARPAGRRARRRRRTSTRSRGYAEDSGEGRWTVEAAIDNAVATAGDHRGAVRPVRLPPGRQPGDEGGRGDAQPVRRPRRQDRARRPAATPRPSRAARPACTSPTCPCTTSAPTPSVEVALEPGVTAFVGPQRAGQDQPGRGDRLPRRGSASHRVAADAPLVRAGADQAVVRAAVVKDGREARARGARSTRAGPTGPGSTGRRCRGPASCSAWCARCVFSPEDLALVKGDPSERRRFLDDLLVLRTPRLRRRARRLRPGAQAAQLAAQDRRRRPPAAAAAPSRRLSTLEVWDAHLARAGAELLARAAGAGRRPAALRRQGLRGGRPRGAPATDATMDYKPSFEPAGRRARRDRDELDRGAARRAASAAATTSSTAACRLVGPHRDDLAAARSATAAGRRATPATASPGRSRSRCGWRRTTCCAPTATTRS